jgi:saccharopine dehydrogenase (NAD+, L-lysine-forming)
MLKIGLIREGKIPPDSRVPLAPQQCLQAEAQFPVKIQVQPSPNRCFSDDEFRQAGARVKDVMEECDILMGVKEVPISQLIPNKTYLFFSHTIKEQAYNRDLLRVILEKNIHLIDYEVLTDEEGRRVIAFGFFAGMVGAHNGILAYGHRTDTFELRPMNQCRDYAEAKDVYRNTVFPPMRVVLTGTGRVGQGAARVLLDMGFRQISPKEYLEAKRYEFPVFTQLNSPEFVAREDGSPYHRLDFHTHPEEYKSIFLPYTHCSDIMINGIFWNNKAPVFFTREDMRHPDFSIQTIADVTCDIAPLASVPSTLRPSTIAEPVYGYDPVEDRETDPFLPHSIDVMAVDNLPNELPRDASESFGRQLLENVMAPLLAEDHPMIARATVAKDGKLGPYFQYLEDFVYSH